MRIAVLSDIHGNMDAFEKVLEDIERSRPDFVYSLGDNIGYGAESERVIQALRQRCIPSVLGNHELAAKDPGFLDWFNPAARQSLSLTFDRLRADSLDFIRKLPHISASRAYGSSTVFRRIRLLAICFRSSRRKAPHSFGDAEPSALSDTRTALTSFPVPAMSWKRSNFRKA